MPLSAARDRATREIRRARGRDVQSNQTYHVPFPPGGARAAQKVRVEVISPSLRRNAHCDSRAEDVDRRECHRRRHLLLVSRHPCDSSADLRRAVSPLTRSRCSSRRPPPSLGDPALSSDTSTNDVPELLADKTKRVRELFHGGGFIPARGARCTRPQRRAGRSRQVAIARDDGGRLRYALFENGEVVMPGDDDADEDGDTDVFPWASEPIARVMPVLLELLNDADGSLNARPLTTGLSAVGFLASRGGEVVVTLWNR